MSTYKECKFYIKGGKCSHKDAPVPRHSYCIGKDKCGAWEDDIKYEVKEEGDHILELLKGGKVIARFSQTGVKVDNILKEIEAGKYGN